MRRWTSYCILSILFAVSTAVTIELDQYQYFCLIKYVEPADTFTGTYVVSGYDDQSVNFHLLSPRNAMVESHQKQKEGNWNSTLPEGGDYRVCFRNVKKDHAFVTVDIHVSTPQAENPFPTISTEDISKIMLDVKETVRLLWKLRANLKFQTIRGNVHTDNIRTLESRIRWSTAYKAIVLILIGVGQVYLIQKLFQKRGKFIV